LKPCIETDYWVEQVGYLKIPTKARYSIRLLVYLADHARPDKPVNLKEIAEEQDLSLRYLEQLVAPLKGAGLVKSVAGKHGGYYLSRDADNIPVGRVVEASIGPLRLLDCLDPEAECRFKDACAARRMWGLVNTRMSDVLFDYSVADLSEKKMRRLIGEDGGNKDKSVLRC